MLAGFNRCGEMDRTERRRGGHDHEVAIGRHQFLIGIEAVEAALGRHAKALASAVSLVLEDVCHSDHFTLDVEDFAGSEEIADSARAATTAADQGDFDLFGGRSERRGKQRGGGETGPNQGAGSEE